MRVIGQFNVGFIIAELGGDLYIFWINMRVMKNIALRSYSWKLKFTSNRCLPQCNRLQSAEEMVLLDNMDIFVKNGF